MPEGEVDERHVVIESDSYAAASQSYAMGKVLAIVNRAISTYLINKAGLKVSEAHTGAVRLIQRFGSALNEEPAFSRAVY